MSEVDISRALKSAITTGKVQFGLDQTMKAVKDGKAQMIILARNCPSKDLKDALRFTSMTGTTWSSVLCAENPSLSLPLQSLTKVAPTS